MLEFVDQGLQAPRAPAGPRIIKKHLRNSDRRTTPWRTDHRGIQVHPIDLRHFMQLYASVETRKTGMASRKFLFLVRDAARRQFSPVVKSLCNCCYVGENWVVHKCIP